MDYSIFIKSYDRIVVLTHEDKEINWKNNEKVVVIPNPLTSPCTSQSSLENKTVISVGRLVHAKNFSSLIDAWKLVASKHPDWTLEIWGEGALRNDLQQQINNLELQQSVYLKGYTYDIQEKMLNASIFVLTSFFEGFGLVIVEAMSCGLPVVSYDCPCGPKDIITEGKDGFLVPVNDEEALAERINILIRNEYIRKQIAIQTLAKIEKYKVNNIITKWMDLFKVIKNNR